MSSSIRTPRAPVVFALILAAAGIAPGLPAIGAESPKLYVHLETLGRFSYSGDPTQVSILVKNEGNADWANPGLDLEGGFQVYDSDGKKLDKAKGAAPPRDAQPKILEPNAYFGKIINLNTLFPKITGTGTYRITWSGPGGFVNVSCPVS